MKKYGPIFRMISLITQLGITMLTSIFLCMFLGLWIDRTFSTHFFLFFLILGVLGGIRGVYTLVRHANEDGQEEEDER
jgi:ATP synthase protein I